MIGITSYTGCTSMVKQTEVILISSFRGTTIASLIAGGNDGEAGANSTASRRIIILTTRHLGGEKCLRWSRSIDLSEDVSGLSLDHDGGHVFAMADINKSIGRYALGNEGEKARQRIRNCILG